jgi:hypothetical protein
VEATASLPSRLSRAKARLDALDFYPEPVRTEGVRVRVSPWFFRLLYPQFHGIALLPSLILMRYPDYSDDLLTHELCHVWQMQQDGMLRTTWQYLRCEYLENPYEQEARRAVEKTLILGLRLASEAAVLAP